jgi:hypothetical protein
LVVSNKEGTHALRRGFLWLADQAERWIVWTANKAGRHGDTDPQADVCRAQGIRLVTYAKTDSGGFTLHAAVPPKT